MLNNKEKLITQAQKFIEKGQYEKAIREYLKIVAEDEKDVRTWLKIGDLFAKLGQKAEAAQTYQKVARFYSEQGFYLKAVAVYKQILRIDPRLTDVNVALASLYRQLGLVQDAITQYEAVAAFLQREGRSREAIAAHQAILELDPDNVAQRIKLAELYSKEELTTEAIAAFAQAAEQLRAIGRLEDFLKVGERLLFHDPDNHPVARELAAHYLGRGDPRRALTKLQGAFKADPTDLDTLELLAQAFMALEQRQKCISVLKEMGRLETERGNREAALLAYRRILELDPEEHDARAAVNHSLSTVLPAARRAMDSSETRPPSPPARAAAASEAETQPDEEVARTITEADVYAKYGLYQRALEHLQRALERQPYLRIIRERLAGLYEALGQPEAAVAQQWALFRQAATREEAASSLSEILRLDPQNRSAIRKWQEVRGRSSRSTPAAPPNGARSSGVSALEALELTLEAGEAPEPPTTTVPRPAPASGVRPRPGQAAEAAEPSLDDAEGAGPSYQMTRQGLRERGKAPEDGAGHYDLGMAYRDMGLYDDALGEFRKAMQGRFSEVRCRTAIGLCHLDLGRPAEAIAEFMRAVAVPGAPGHELIEVYYYLGLAHERTADRQESLGFYEKALAQDPGYRDAQERVALLRAMTTGTAKG